MFLSSCKVGRDRVFAWHGCCGGDHKGGDSRETEALRVLPQLNDEVRKVGGGGVGVVGCGASHVQAQVHWKVEVQG